MTMRFRAAAKPPDNIPRVVISTAIGFWLVSIVVFRESVPVWLQVAAGVAMFVFIAGVVGFLILGQSGWSELARSFPSESPFDGPRRTCQTAVMSAVGLDDPEHARRRVRLNFILRLGTDEEALHLSAPAIVSLFLPSIRIPWSAIGSARIFDASGWIEPPSEPGALVQLLYDPGYTGKFVEIEIAEPRYFLQLPAHLLAQALPRLPIASV